MGQGVARVPGGGFPQREQEEPKEIRLADAAAALKARLMSGGFSEETADQMVLAWWLSSER